MALVQYAFFYDSIMQLPPSDRPADDVIEDDAALDKWFERYTRDLARKQGKRQGTALSEEEARALIPKYNAP